MEEQNSNDALGEIDVQGALVALLQVERATVDAISLNSPVRAICQHGANLHRDLIRVARWIENHAEHVADAHVSSVSSVWVTTHMTREAYDALTVALQQIADLGSIEPPGVSGGSFTTAKVGEVYIYIYPPGGVCEKVEVGTRLVEKPDPAAPMVVVREPIYEYRCSGEGVEA